MSGTPAVTSTSSTAPGRPVEESRRADALRLMVFVSSVMLLFFLARQGQSQPVMYVAFTFFVVAATLWVRALDANWVVGRPDYRSRVVFVAALVVPVLVTILVGIVRGGWVSTLVLGGLITVYIAAGLGVRRLRWWVINHPDPVGVHGPLADRLSGWFVTKVCRPRVLAAVVVLAYGAIWLLGRIPPAAALVLVVVLLVPVPALVHVLSERAVVRLSGQEEEARRHRWIGGGAFALSLGWVVGVIYVDTNRYVLVLVVLTAVLTWAFAAGSLADIAAVLAALALMGVTPGSQEVKPVILTAPPSAGQESVVVSLGDSYSSGEGAARYLDETNVAGGNQCRRAATAWPVLVAEAVDADRLVFRACSGARARNVVGTAPDDEQYAGEGIQVVKAVADLRARNASLDPSLVLLSIGGNDAGFRQIGSSCLSLGSCEDTELSELFDENLPAVEEALRSTYLQVTETFPGSPVAVMPYPDAFAGEDGCVRAPVEPGDIDFVRDFTGRLDAIIEDVATETGVYYVSDMRTALVGSKLALCDPSGTPGLNFLDLRGVGGGTLDRSNPGNWIHNSLHPNERGHAALAAAFTGWLSAQTRTDTDGTVLTGLAALEPAGDRSADEDAAQSDAEGSGGVGTGTAPATGTELCFEKDGGRCGPEADAWALRQLGPGLVGMLVLAGWVAVSSWLLAVGWSASRIRRLRHRMA